MDYRVKLEGEGEKWLRLELVDVPLSLANAVRRLIINEVPTMAVEEVLVIENTSALTNEVLAHRISLIPFTTDLDNYVLPERCDCGSSLGCEKCSVRFSLRSMADKEVVSVYSSDLIRESGSEKVAPVSGDFQIVKLAPGQRVELELYVRLGKGKRHAKWQAGIATLYEEGGKRLLYVESFGQLPARRILLEAVKIFEESLAELSASLEKVVADGGGEG
ncbi:MAG: DNA-directed RNA polymerase subunit D [Nitrososphaerota archaeon]|nr:DNA-directed RNA polymerase subunit D [Candidatus Calditenuaceae archaeon]MDW8072750.1 DNA-directed RNA polymerase subunit D [Nitrososphaerota archaeon]